MMVSEIFLAGALLAGSPDVLVRATANGAPEETISPLADSVVDGLASAGVEASVGDAWSADCTGDPCVREAMSTTSATAVVILSVEQQDNVYKFSLEARSRTTGQRLASAEDVCEICGLEEVAELVELRAASLGPRLDRPEVGTIRVTSDPPGAKVYVDDRNVGITPMDVELAQGEHAVRVEKPGFLEDGQSVEVVAGVEDDLRFRLMPVGDPEKDVARRWFIAGGVSLGFGAVAIGGGIPLILMDMDPYTSNCRADAQGNCAKLYDTMGPGASLVTAGAIGVAAGTAMLLIGRKRRGGRALEAQPAPGGMAVRF